MNLYLSVKSENSRELEVMNARIMIEPGIAEYAALRYSDENLRKLKENFQMMKENTDVKEHARLDIQFHLLIADSSKNILIPLILELIYLLQPQLIVSVNI